MEGLIKHNPAPNVKLVDQTVMTMAVILHRDFWVGIARLSRRWIRDVHFPLISNLVSSLVSFSFTNVRWQFMHSFQVILEVISSCKCLEVTSAAFIKATKVHSRRFVHTLLMPIPIVGCSEAFNSVAARDPTTMQFLMLDLMFPIGEIWS